jgi:vacuolar iron transporter family protein
VVLGAIGAVTVGLVLARFTARSYVRAALRQLAIAAVAAGVTYAVGSAVGVGV